MSAPPPPTPEVWKRTKDLFHRAIDLPMNEREAFLDRETNGDPDIRRAVVDLLHHHDGATDDFMSEPVARFDADALHRLAGDHHDPLLNRDIGNYTIKSVIGLGGMGVVYRAEQHAPRRDVALKLIRPGMATPTLLQRFEREAFLLGRVNHPGIARILELGSFTTDIGDQPYIAMELVDGEALLDAASERQWTIRHRIQVMTHVCDIVQHAHQKGIIHRDLKPGNILVDREDAPHVLDFGIARLTGAQRADHDTQTVAGQVLGTIHYMSPEQLEGDQDDIDTRSDVYALGVVLYELLAGERPYLSNETRQFDLPYLICSGNPPRLGTKNRECRGELELIVHKAFDADRNRRYPSAAALADDLRRFLDHRPVSAHRDSTVYSIRKWLRRRKVIAAMLAALLGVVLTSAVLVVDAYRKEQDARTLTDDVARRVTRFARARLDAIVQPGAPELPDDTELEEMAQLYHDAATIDPGVRAQLGALVGEGYLKQNEYLAAESFMRPAWEHYRANAEWSLDHALSAYHLGRIVSQQWRLDEALALYQECLAGYVAHLPSDDARILNCRNDIAVCQRRLGRLRESEESFRWLLDQRRIINADEPFWIAASANNLGTCLKMQGRFDEAREFYREAESIITASEGINPIYVARCWRSIAECLNGLGDHDAARHRLDQAIDFLHVQNLDHHADMATSYVELAHTMLMFDDDAAARDLLNRADTIYAEQTAFTRPHQALTDRDLTLAEIHLANRAPVLAAPLLEQAKSDLMTLVPSNHPSLGRLHLLQATAALIADDFERADRELEGAAERLETGELTDIHPDRMLLDLLRAETALGQDDEAETARICSDAIGRTAPDLEADHWILTRLRVLLKACEGENTSRDNRSE